MSIPRTPFRRLLAERTMKGLTQPDMANLLELSVDGYRKKERNDYEFTLSEISKLVNFFDVEFEELFKEYA